MMRAEELILENALFSQTIENVSSHPEVRTIQTKMTNQQFADLGLLVIDSKHNQSRINQFVGLENFTFTSHHPQLVQVSNFEGLVNSAAFQAKKSPDWLEQFDERLCQLHETAIEDGIEISKNSLSEIKAFAASMHGARMPTVFLVGNGNFRLRWSNNQDEKVGLQFRGDGEVQYLFFKRVGNKMEQMLGTKLRTTIVSFIATCGLRHVIAE
jgi:hypothetical protein